jgi:hypothetical protein
MLTRGSQHCSQSFVVASGDEGVFTCRCATSNLVLARRVPAGIASFKCRALASAVHKDTNTGMRNDPVVCVSRTHRETRSKRLGSGGDVINSEDLLNATPDTKGKVLCSLCPSLIHYSLSCPFVHVQMHTDPLPLAVPPHGPFTFESSYPHQPPSTRMQQQIKHAKNQTPPNPNPNPQPTTPPDNSLEHQEQPNNVITQAGRPNHNACAWANWRNWPSRRCRVGQPRPQSAGDHSQSKSIAGMCSRQRERIRHCGHPHGPH